MAQKEPKKHCEFEVLPEGFDDRAVSIPFEFQGEAQRTILPSLNQKKAEKSYIPSQTKPTRL